MHQTKLFLYFFNHFAILDLRPCTEPAAERKPAGWAAMKKPKQPSAKINAILFRSYMLAMFAVLLAVTVIFAAIEFNSLNRNVRSKLQQANHSVALSVDNQIKQMDTISISALYSNLLKNSFSTYSDQLDLAEDSTPNPAAKVGNAKILHDLMFAIIGVNNDIKQINLYNTDRGSFGSGLYNGYIDQNLRDMPWYPMTLEAEGKRFVTKAHDSALFASSQRQTAGRDFVSLCRIYFDKFNRMDGAIEVVEYYDTVFDSAMHAEGAYKLRFYIYDANGTLLYPKQASSMHADDYRRYAAGQGSDQAHTYDNAASGQREFLISETMPYSNFLSVAVVDSDSFYAPITQFFVLLIAIFLAGLLICYLTARRLARRLALPLTSMHTHLSAIDYEQRSWEKLNMDATGIIEIDDLSASVDRFQDEILRATDEILLLQRHEAQSQMLALQSQMNPHFLYNSIATIQAMADEGMNEEIAQMSDAISTILRYVSSTKESMVRLELELETTDLYLDCHHFRFGDNLRYRIDVPDDMLDVSVPKLCVQLLVENAIKYTSVSVPPPFEILVQCLRSDNQWLVSVYDNGSGFPDDVIESITKKTHAIENTGRLPSLELKGMGLMNLYIRLWLIYKHDCVFEIGNREQGGAFVRIGGRLDA